jgi:UDP-glucose 4-epimerase
LNIWITGGAGYIGSTIAHACRVQGVKPIIIDDLSAGFRDAVADMTFYRGDFSDTEMLRAVIAKHGRPSVVVHAAGLVSASASVSEPLAYYRTNVLKTLHLCQFLIDVGCQRLVVESSAAVYGDTAMAVVGEEAPTDPVSPYAYSKAALERMLRDISVAHALHVVCFRLFNVVGLGEGQQRRRTPVDVLSRLQNAVERGGEFTIYGTDWPTVDGTPLRDFVHVQDVARAHLSLIMRPDWQSYEPFEVFNLATGVGTTVRQLVCLYQSLDSGRVRVRTCGRRPGDIAGFVGDASRARTLLGWSPLSDALHTDRQTRGDGSTNVEVLSAPGRPDSGGEARYAEVAHIRD